MSWLNGSCAFAVVVIYPGTLVRESKTCGRESKVRKSTLMCVRESSRKQIWNISLAKATLHAAKASRKLVRRFSIRPNKLYGIKTTTHLEKWTYKAEVLSKVPKCCERLAGFDFPSVRVSVWDFSHWSSVFFELQKFYEAMVATKPQRAQCWKLNEVVCRRKKYEQIARGRARHGGSW